MKRELTPLPGVAIVEPERKRVRDLFISQFVRPNQRHLPFWFSFPYLPIGRDVFHTPEFRNQKELYFMISNGSQIHHACGDEISEFFAHQKPWEGMLIYVFDEAAKWCIASTDEMFWDPGHDADFLIVKAGDLCLPHTELREPGGRDHYPRS